jgi:YbbR domain-containing protein
MSLVRKLLVVAFAFGVLAMGMGCGTPIKDGVVLAINPSVVRVGVDKVATVQVVLTKARTEDGTMTFLVDDNTIIGAASGTSEVSVKKGDDMVFFDIQGLKQGTTRLKAKLDGNIVISAPVIVSDQ